MSQGQLPDKIEEDLLIRRLCAISVTECSLVGEIRGVGDTYVSHLQTGGLMLPATKNQSARSREDFGRIGFSK
jgi:hypothetical protein